MSSSGRRSHDRRRLKFPAWKGAWVIVTLALVLGETFVESQYYFPQQLSDRQGATNDDGAAVLTPPSSRAQYYFYDDQSFLPGVYEDSFPMEEGAPAEEEEATLNRVRRRAVDTSDEDEDDEADDVRAAGPKISVTLPSGRPKPVKLPKRFNDRVNKRIKMSRKSKKRLHGDPDPIDEEDEEGRKPEGRVFWPFSIEITKGQKDKGGWGGPGGPGGYGSYHEWAAQTGFGGGPHGQGGWGGWGPISGPYGSWGEHGAGQHGKHPYGWKPGDLTDEEILNSKHYKKYRKKKKKKIKKLKKKLKFKRLVQKILQKHITYLDKIAPY